MEDELDALDAYISKMGEASETLAYLRDYSEIEGWPTPDDVNWSHVVKMEEILDLLYIIKKFMTEENYD